MAAALRRVFRRPRPPAATTHRPLDRPLYAGASTTSRRTLPLKWEGGRHTRHSASAVYVHLVWATWDRLPLLVGEVEACANRAIGAESIRLGAEIVALGSVAGHVHLLVRLPMTLSVAELVGKVKGSTSHLITHELLTDGSFFKWQGSYGAVSVSPRHLPDVATYVAQQKVHHADGSLRAGLEPP